MKSGKIQKKVPIPGLSSEVKYPWPKINVGDSASFEPVKNEALDQFIRKVITSWRYYGYKMDKKFNTLLMRKESSVRVWRIRVKKGEKRNKF